MRGRGVVGVDKDKEAGMIALPDRDWPAFNSWLDELFKAGPPTGPLTHRIEDGVHNFYAEDGTLVAQMGEGMYNILKDWNKQGGGE